jgi:hypothetical protein
MATQTPPLSNPEDRHSSGDKLWRRLVEAIARILFTSPQIPAAPKNTPSLEPVEIERGAACARERRRRIEGMLAEPGPTGILGREFLEIPPGAEGVEPRLFPENSLQAFAQMARLRWELQADETLLIERLVDTFVIFQRRAQSPRFSDVNHALAVEDPLIRLRRKKALEEKGLFPWVAVIETQNPSLYMEFLEPLRNWLGIGVEFAPISFPQLLATCREAGGRRGSVGGLVAAQGVRSRQVYKLTCAHVISPECSSVVVRSFPSKNDWDVPDAALLRLESPCFWFDAAAGTIKPVDCITPNLIRECVDDETSIVKSNGSHAGCPGHLYEPGVLLPKKVYGHSVRFPHLNIKPDTKSYLFGLLPVPFFSRRFSNGGDSGSWAIESKTGSWLGMIVASDGYKGTWLVEGAPLLAYLKQQLQKVNGSAADFDLTPFTYSNSSGRK